MQYNNNINKNDNQTIALNTIVMKRKIHLNQYSFTVDKLFLSSNEIRPKTPKASTVEASNQIDLLVPTTYFH